jgi:hypothetical protein
VALTGSQSIYAYAHATDGSLTIQPKCVPVTGAMGSCSFLLTPGAGQVSVDVVPANPQTINAPGVSGPVQATWSYSWTFTGLNLVN